ncbi:MAG TPA: cysteine--tRNA ligase [Tissierellia bacterium]|nr:cysteine--tRNA ligase [Tissierellia bacterium]
MKLYNTISGAVEEFVPINPGQVLMYTCGPTVYNYAHIGNLRTYVSEDILVRTFELNGYDVTRVMNVTDVGHLTDDGDDGEDKMLTGARRENKTVWEIAKHYEEAFFEDMKKLRLKDPSIVERATDHIANYIEFIKVLEKKGYTYRAGGNVYFDVSKVPDYTKLSKVPLDQLQTGARAEVVVDDNKKNPYDFVLWFTKSRFDQQEMRWPSPFGEGYPGWHLECSVIALETLGEQMDIHCGGVDHIMTHHTNEIAQTESYTGKPWVRYWWHAEFLLDAEGKMSKSRGEFLTLALLEAKGFSPMHYKYYLLGSHYRKQLPFTFSYLEGAKDAYEKLRDRVLALDEPETCNAHMDDFVAALNDDLNTASALTVVYDVLKDDTLTSGQKAGALMQMEEVLQLGLFEKRELQVEEEWVLEKIAERSAAKEKKDWETADAIREELREKGIAIMDGKDGTTWKPL